LLDGLMCALHGPTGLVSFVMTTCVGIMRAWRRQDDAVDLVDVPTTMG